MKVYIVMEIDYGDFNVRGVFTALEAAMAREAGMNYGIEEWEIGGTEPLRSWSWTCKHEHSGSQEYWWCKNKEYIEDSK